MTARARFASRSAYPASTVSAAPAAISYLVAFFRERGCPRAGPALNPALLALPAALKLSLQDNWSAAAYVVRVERNSIRAWESLHFGLDQARTIIPKPGRYASLCTLSRNSPILMPAWSARINHASRPHRTMR